MLGIMVGIAALQLFVPVPGFGAGTFEPASAINGLKPVYPVIQKIWLSPMS
jgi:hypothetical protein